MPAKKPFVQSFSGVNVDAQRAAKKRAAKLITAISEETRQNVRLLIVRSIKEGIAPYDAARMIRGMVGLNARQGQATMNYRALLVKQELTNDRIALLTQRYADKQLKSRAVTIARTETMGALNEGQKAAWRDAQKEGLLGRDAKKEWITADPCPICEPLDGEQVLLDDSFSESDPPLHPNCRCSLGIVP